MRIIAGAMLGCALIAIAACHKNDADADDDAAAITAGFHPPTNMTRADYLDILDKRFNRLDRNRDGALTADEIPAARAGRLMPFDTNHNGEISHEEFIAGGLARFDADDTNHDKTLTSNERRAARDLN